MDGRSRAVLQFSVESELPFDRYATRKFAETLLSGRLVAFRVLFAIQQRLMILTRNFADFETTARATFLTSFVPVQRSVQIRQLPDGPQTIGTKTGTFKNGRLTD